jgi:hypothetical protein
MPRLRGAFGGRLDALARAGGAELGQAVQRYEAIEDRSAG